MRDNTSMWTNLYKKNNIYPNTNLSKKKEVSLIDFKKN